MIDAITLYVLLFSQRNDISAQASLLIDAFFLSILFYKEMEPMPKTFLCNPVQCRKVWKTLSTRLLSVIVRFLDHDEKNEKWKLLSYSFPLYFLWVKQCLFHLDIHALFVLINGLIKYMHIRIMKLLYVYLVYLTFLPFLFNSPITSPSLCFK